MGKGIIDSIRGLARQVGRSHTTMREWIAHPAWPFSRKGPWRREDVGAMQRWAERELSPDPSAEPGISNPTDGQSPKTKAQTLLALKRVQHLAHDLKVKEGKFHDVEACRLHRLRQLAELRRRLLSIPDSLPFSAEDRELVRGLIRNALFALAGEKREMQK